MTGQYALEALPPLRPLDAADGAEDDDCEPEVIPGRPLSAIILEAHIGFQGRGF